VHPSPQLNGYRREGLGFLCLLQPCTVSSRGDSVELARLFSVFDHESAVISMAFVVIPTSRDGTRCSMSHELARESATIGLQDRWGSFCRSLILVSAVGPARTSSGMGIPRQNPTAAEALRVLRSSFTGRSKKSATWEPKWFDPSEAIDAAQRLGIPNLSTVSAALGSTPSPLDDLRVVRNFFAHRGQLAGSTMRNSLGLGSTLAAHTYLTEVRIGGALRFETWVRTLQRMARAAVR
jgi:hypothetical protein